MKKYLFLLVFLFLFACGESQSSKNEQQGKETTSTIADYKGTASVTQGLAKTDRANIYECERGRKTDVGTIISSDGKSWTVPALTNFNNEEFPFAADLHNPCNGNTYANAEEALSKLADSDIIAIDETGDLYTAYIFADNYFEMYVNGQAVGKDNVPFTQFNSNVVRFKVNKPFTIAMKLVDWEEHLGIGTEKSRGKSSPAGDGGMVAVIKDADDKIISITGENWKAQTFYTAPIKDLSCVSEKGSIRQSNNCDETDSDEGSSYFGLHWELPMDWEKQSFDDADWPNAVTYTNETIGVDNKKAYTNFKDIFDDKEQDAQFIWSSNVVLDNEVIVRYTVE